MTRKGKMDIAHPYGPWMLVTNYRQNYSPGRTQKSQSDYRSEAEGTQNQHLIVTSLAQLTVAQRVGRGDRWLRVCYVGLIGGLEEGQVEFGALREAIKNIPSPPIGPKKC